MLADRIRRLGAGAAALAAVVALGAAAGVLGAAVDWAAFGHGLARAGSDPAGMALAAAAFAAAFALRAAAWCRVLRRLGFGQSLAALHVALGANHVLPLRLGEPLRIVSAVRRAGVPAGDATSSTIALRSADVLVLLGLGTIVGPTVVWDLLGPWGPAGVLAIALVGAGAVGILVRQRGARGPGALRLPGGLVLAATVAAWLAEAVVVWQAARWFGVELAPTDAVLVLAAAVSAQLVAVAPGGVGTYEAAATVALVAVGADPTVAVTTALGLHAVKTVYSLLAGGLAVFLPTPGLLGRFRLPRSIQGERRPTTVPAGPVVLLLPAHDEAPRVAEVIRRAPATVAGRPVEVVVVDDGSTDDTALAAAAAGARVVRHGTNRGLGAAIRTGFEVATERGASAVAFCDADGEYDPAELDRLVGPILDGRADYVVGNRFTDRRGHMHLHRWLGNRALTAWVRVLTREAVSDGQSGYRALSARAAATAEIPHDYNYAQVLTVDLLQRGFGYLEVPVSYTFRRSGRSFVRLGTYLRRVVPAVWRQLNREPVSTPVNPANPVDPANPVSRANPVSAANPVEPATPVPVPTEETTS